jgi:predicted anti-sigma-YlaC factor YlaD
MTCQEVVELVTDYLEGALPSEERARFDVHIARCAGCRAYIEQLHVTLRLTGTLTEAALSPRTRDELLGAFRAWRRS